MTLRWSRRDAVLLAAATAIASCVLSASPAAHAAASRIRWGRAEAVPGLAALNKGYNAGVTTLACWAAGGCAAGGFYTDKHHRAQAFVALERKDRWGTAVEVAGSARLNAGGNAQVQSVSCTRSAGCMAVATYTDRHKNTQWFTAAERDGRWGKAAPVPVPALAQAAISTVWCAPGGWCMAGGLFTDSTGTGQSFVTTETSGRWGAATDVPGTEALTVPGGYANIGAVSCTSPGNCAIGGTYKSSNGPDYGFGSETSAWVATETNGVWGAAEQVPGIAAIDLSFFAGVSMMSCPSPGNCTAAGYVAANSPDYCSWPCVFVFAVSELNGVWQGVQTPGSYGLIDFMQALTCWSAGYCVLVGESAIAGTPNTQAEAEIESNSRWSREVLFDGGATAAAVSCSSPGYCASGGQSSNGSAFVVSERHGTWGRAATPAGTPARYAPNTSVGATVSAVACPPRIDLCAAGGSYAGPKGGLTAFVVSQTG